jgi:hypothetical protein
MNLWMLGPGKADEANLTLLLGGNQGFRPRHSEQRSGLDRFHSDFMDLPQIQAIGLQSAQRILLAFASPDSCPVRRCILGSSRKHPAASLLKRCPIAPRSPVVILPAVSAEGNPPIHGFLKRSARRFSRRAHHRGGGRRALESKPWRQIGRTVEPEYFHLKFAAFRSRALFHSRLLTSRSPGHRKPWMATSRSALTEQARGFSEIYRAA